ncbi:glycosyltransferase family 4 protein [Afifella marina]|uniref:Glycosyltransferase involved in cell wall bisynthesis n=1 Tax=Afifella marina DSM 2698 TaxID=1120955 RepID=A0A1G5NEB7_AFIMA|nr:glycosyltransferase family 4 protein [Afifella marina]MBK1623330.1 glycosyl transferase [Afifella marina DSM 2698]MBK1626324.1 glycosyl transferase [Afifella marina]MBK5917202.1 glycosyl transferase [Afifella marina]RAI22175.1 glycosyl transferase [Afifella marina DSM 2698]SCZ35278.1 Glycosyltransferase involved in cell wall bisynthesis [Afifella marina DSM 2698]
MSKTILQVIPQLETGGAERTAVDMAAAVVETGGRALVASEGGRMEEELQAKGGEVVRLPVASKNPFVMAANARRLAALIRKEKVDLVHARSRAPAWSALLACRMTGVPFITTYHGIYNQNGAVKGLYNSVMARGTEVIANSDFTARIIMQRHGTPRERIRTIYRGTDLARFDPVAVPEARIEALRQAWDLPAEQPVILNVARITQWKGQPTLIEAAARFAESKDFVLVLAGDAQGREAYLAGLRRQVSEAGLSERVRIPGHCDDVPAALALASVAVVASVEAEAFGRFAVEAQAMGVPAIVTDLGPSRETVLAPPEAGEAERTGWRVPAGDAAALAEALDHALSLTHLEIDDLARRARSHASRFSLDAMTRETLALYEEVLSRGENT